MRLKIGEQVVYVSTGHHHRAHGLEKGQTYTIATVDRDDDGDRYTAWVGVEGYDSRPTFPARWFVRLEDWPTYQVKELLGL